MAGQLPNEKERRALAAKRQEAADLLFAHEHPGHIFEHEGWDVMFMGWRMAINHVIEFAIWRATKAGDPGYWASTTFGVCRYHPKLTDPFDLEFKEGWPGIVFDNKERAMVALRAGSRLLDALSERG